MNYVSFLYTISGLSQTIKEKKLHKVLILVTNLKISCFIISLLYASAYFEHYVLIIRRSKLYYTASGIITPVDVVPCTG